MLIDTGIYRHFSGVYYRVIGMVTHTETHEELTVYYPLNTSPTVMYARPAHMFLDEVSVLSDDGKTSKLVKRFRYIGELDE